MSEAPARPAAAPPGAASPEDGGYERHHVAALAVVGLTALIVSLTQSLLIPVLPQLAVDLRSSASATEWLLTSTLLVAAVAVPVAGRLGDLYGKRLMLMPARR